MFKKLRKALVKMMRPSKEKQKRINIEKFLNSRIENYQDEFRLAEKAHKVKSSIILGTELLLKKTPKKILDLKNASHDQSTLDEFIVLQFEHLVDLSVESSLGFTEELYNIANSILINRLRLNLIETKEVAVILAPNGKLVELTYNSLERGKIKRLTRECLEFCQAA